MSHAILSAPRAFVALVLGVAAISANAADCKAVHAELIEMGATTECDPGETSCFIGVVQGNHGLVGTTHFKADSWTTPIPTSPGSFPYSGLFEYRLAGGTLRMRETGVTVPGIVTAHHRIQSATGDFEGATGDFFVYGTRASGVITTRVDGTLCFD